MTSFEGKLARRAEPVPGIRRLLAPNPSMMTGPGTNTYLVGTREVAVIDPGPADPAHVDAIVAYAAAPIRWILATHTHPDHSPGVALLRARTSARVLGRPPPAGRHQDMSFRPDEILGDGDELVAGEFRLRAIHTPGHASNHLCFLHDASRALLTGDHIVNGSTVVIDPPDGNMRDYLASLRRLRELAPACLLPGHGDRIDDPAGAIDRLLAHRLERERRVRAALDARESRSLSELVPRVYRDVAVHLYPVAERSLQAHLEKLVADGVAKEKDGRWRLAAPPALA